MKPLAALVGLLRFSHCSDRVPRAGSSALHGRLEGQDLIYPPLGPLLLMTPERVRMGLAQLPQGAPHVNLAPQNAASTSWAAAPTGLRLGRQLELSRAVGVLSREAELSHAATRRGNR